MWNEILGTSRLLIITSFETPVSVRLAQFSSLKTGSLIIRIERIILIFLGKNVLEKVKYHSPKMYNNRSHNRGRRPQVRAISSIEVGPMIWDNFSIFRTNCAIACGTRVYMLRGFLRMSRRENAVQNFRNLLYFWPTTQHVYVCWNFA